MSLSRRVALVATLSVTAAIADGAASVELPFDGSAAGWRHVELPSISRPTDWAVVHSGVEALLHARAAAGASCLVHPVSAVGPVRLRWRWRVDQGLRQGDGTARSTDDFAARVAVGFAGDWSDAGWFARREAEALRERLGQWPPRRWIHYVWSGGQRLRGETFDEPYRPEDVKCVALRVAGDPGRRWFDEEVTPAADYARVFGGPAPAVVAIMLMTDADDTGAVAEAWYAGIRVVPE